MTLQYYEQDATPLDPDEVEGLKLKHITTRSELNRWEQENIQEAFDWLSRRRKVPILTESFICRLHEKMFGKVWKWAGQFRRTGKNIGVDWTAIPIELRQLLDDVKYWIEHKVYSQDEIAVRLHHKLVLIHAFPNGNGRHARLMTDILLTDVLEQQPFSWGSGNLIDTGTLRGLYISALKAADRNDYSLLKEFVRS
jgi:Fic-DOC domain mobile mystery protein B